MEKFLYNNKLNKSADYNVWLAFPGSYSFAMSSLGYLWLFKSMQELDSINVERIYANDMRPSTSIKNVNLIGFSFSFDLDFLNIFKILENYELPLKSNEREEGMPLIFGGGPVLSTNPAPYLNFFDFIIVGDGEELNNKAVELCAKNKDKSKSEILKLLSKIEGIYVPNISKDVTKVTCGLSNPIFTPILSEKAFFKNTFIIEISRGCSNRCGFCLASYLNLPVRFADYDEIIKTLNLGLSHTNKVALLGAQISAHPRFDDICEYLYEKIQENSEIEVGVSSLRADYISPITIKMLVAGGQKSSTIAIESGSERLRKVINKNLTQEQIFKTIESAQKNGLQGLKCYAMIGLPTETQEDLVELINLAKNMKQQVKGFDLSFSISSFVPKAHTPFQWAAREDIKALEAKQNFLKKEFHKLGIKTNFSSIKWDYYQTLLSRGDNSFTDYLIDVYKKGSNLGAFKNSAKNKIDTDYFVTRQLALDEELPWDFIKLSPDKNFLKREYSYLINL